MRLSRTRHRRREQHRRLQTRPRILAEYIRYGSDGSTLAFLPTTARTTALWLPDASGVYQQYGNGEVGIIDGNAVWCQPSATNYTDGTDDLSGGPETVDLTSPGTGNYTLSVIGTAAVTVAAGTAVGTGFGQATEGNPVTFNLSSAGTVTLTLDSGTLDTIGSSAAKQIEKNAFATSFIPTPAGTPVAINATRPVVPWPSGLVNDFVIKAKSYLYPGATGGDQRIFSFGAAANNSGSMFVSATKTIAQMRAEIGSVNPRGSANVTNLIGRESEWCFWKSSEAGLRGYSDETLITDVVWEGSYDFEDLTMDYSSIPYLYIGALSYNLSSTFNSVGAISNLRIYKVDPTITEAQVLALP